MTLLVSLNSSSLFAGTEPKAPPLADRLAAIRTKVNVLEEGILSGKQSENNIQIQLRKIQSLLKLQKFEQELTQKRLGELEHTINELEVRRIKLEDKMSLQKSSIRRYLMTIENSYQNEALGKLNPLHLPEQEKLEGPRRKMLANLIDRGLKEVEILQADLSDAAQLHSRIQDEKQQLTYLTQELKEQESVLELNRQLQYDILIRKRQEHMVQFENYRKLKTSEAQVEHLITEFNARKELENDAKLPVTTAMIDRAINQGTFEKLKGKLPFPIEGGKVVGDFGRNFDRQSGMHVFKKGIEIAARNGSPVRAVSEGKIAFSGRLPNYGQVVIIDHGNHYYSLCAHLDKILKKVEEPVRTGDVVGLTGDSANPLYFEIRARNIAVNPLQWLFN